jgi:hypothetical protein
LRRLAKKERKTIIRGGADVTILKKNAFLSTFITYLDPEESRASAHVFTKRIKPLRAFSSWKDQTNQEIGSDEGERELLLKERESLLLTLHE